ncbi:hypothetical protein BEH94_07485 [Candidatus Altiarchaeales archaeon WOR_SM1_SCG]|nr:hypothetical protein BEH94_07485 [Candidatus Altiarchaeales archaeon WOR_SM1_SCG]
MKTKFLILIQVILLSIIVSPAFVSGIESIKIESLTVTPSEVFVSEEAKVVVSVKNDGTENITNIEVDVRAGGENICTEKINLLRTGKTDEISCIYIPDDCNSGEDYVITATASIKGSSDTTKPVFVKVAGKVHEIEIPKNPSVNNEITLVVRDADGKLIDNAKIEIKFNDYLIVEDKIQDSIFKFTPENEGTYTVFIEKEREGYCKINKEEFAVKNSFIVHNLKTRYGIDGYMDIKITDSRGNTVDKVNIIVSGPLSREFTTQDGSLKFKLKDKGFEKGEYLIIFQEYKESPERAQMFWELTEKFVVSDEVPPETETGPEEEPEELEPEPEPERLEEPVENENISEIFPPGQEPEIITTPLHRKSFLEKYWLWILILIFILIVSIIIFIIIRQQHPGEKQKPGGLRGL